MEKCSLFLPADLLRYMVSIFESAKYGDLKIEVTAIGRKKYFCILGVTGTIPCQRQIRKLVCVASTT